MNIRDRVKEFRRVPASELRPNPKNWRTHPKAQQDALRGLLAEVGFAGAELCRELDDGSLMLIDGHCRAEIMGTNEVPCLVLDVDEAEADKLLATFDPIGTMAGSNASVLDELLREVQTGSEALASMLAENAAKAGLYIDSDDVLEAEEGESAEKKEEFRGIWGIMPEVRFPSTNAWELPDIREDMLSDQIPDTVFDGTDAVPPEKTLYVFGTGKYQEPQHAGGVLAFYVDDERFESIWNSPAHHVARWTRFGWGSVIAADFSMWRNDPLAVQMWALFRSRWLARYWQEARIKIIPSLNWSDERTHEWAFAGIPRGAPVVSLQCRTSNDLQSRTYFMRGVKAAVSQLAPQNVLIYGGATHREEIEGLLPDGPVYHFLDDWSAVRRRRKAMKNADVRGNGGGGGGSPIRGLTGGLVGA